jgi:hypothetical protein
VSSTKGTHIRNKIHVFEWYWDMTQSWCVIKFTIIFGRYIFVCLFIATQAIFQLSGGCHQMLPVTGLQI